MLKLRIAFCLALVVGTLTLINGILYGARAITIVYRVVISTAVFGFAGYCLGVGIEQFLKILLIKDREKRQKRQHLDTTSEQQTTNELSTESPFSPFTSGNFEQISRPKE